MQAFRTIRLAFSCLCGLLAAGCAASPQWNLPDDHPANPAAAEAPAPAPSDTLRVADGGRRATPVVEAPDADATGDATAAAYTCPHHPEVRQDSPGDCPKCGMELEPEATPADGAAEGDPHAGHDMDASRRDDGDMAHGNHADDESHEADQGHTGHDAHDVHEGHTGHGGHQ